MVDTIAETLGVWLEATRCWTFVARPPTAPANRQSQYSSRADSILIAAVANAVTANHGEASAMPRRPAGLSRGRAPEDSARAPSRGRRVTAPLAAPPPPPERS